MKTSLPAHKNTCKNELFSIAQKYITSKCLEMPCIAAVWGRLYEGKSDKESSHVVGKIFDARVN